MKRKITLLATILGGLLAASAVQAGPTLLTDAQMEMATAGAGFGTEVKRAVRLRARPRVRVDLSDGYAWGYGGKSSVTAQESSGDIVPLMKVRAGVQKSSRNCKIIRRNGVVR